ncbi:AzlC family ABC transporter permease [Glycomyces albidus]|uniref:Branched-chain amino acid ABC transporter permease n=1 Tax=Glycomyces albidus TaxID=2656774 RepID=A0A6L5G2E4_9ACTN|nr:AzlC family ABC transporter permease [Glycomyces albidus]MQM24342.1 branched-chain amino acid ABC transporter permease [Glycomyces albidus]
MFARLTGLVGRDLLRDTIAYSVGIAVAGASFGALATAQGLQWWTTMAVSVLVYAGTAQFAALGVAASGGGPLAVVATGLVLNLRHVPYGLSVGHLYWDRWWTRLLGTQNLLDTTTAFALAEGDDLRRAKIAYWTTGAGNAIAWIAGNLAGIAAGRQIASPEAFGLDAALPAIILALVLPALRDRSTLLACAVGAAIALATSPFLTGGLPVLLALAGLAFAWPPKEPEEAQR